MPIHGKHAFLDEALNSVRNQTLKNFEVLMVLDRPDEDLMTTVHTFCQNDSRFRYEISKGAGIVDALNLGLKSIKTKYIARFDSDDIMMDSRLEKQVTLMEKLPKVGVLASQVLFVNEKSENIGKSNYPTSANDIEFRLKLQNCIAHPSVIIRKSEILRIGGYSGSMAGAEDYELWLRFLKHSKIYVSSEYLIGYRINSFQYSRKLGNIQEYLENAARLKYFRDIELPNSPMDSLSWQKFLFEQGIGPRLEVFASKLGRIRREIATGNSKVFVIYVSLLRLAFKYPDIMFKAMISQKRYANEYT